MIHGAADVVVMGLPDEVADTNRALLRITDSVALSSNEADEAAERAWQRREEATSELLHALGVQMAQCIQTQHPEVRLIVLREDLSHLPAHGHVDLLVGSDGQPVQPQATSDGHHWPAEADDLAWEIYHIAPHHFIRDPDGTKRLTIEIVKD